MKSTIHVVNRPYYNLIGMAWTFLKKGDVFPLYPSVKPPCEEASWLVNLPPPNNVPPQK